MEHIQVPVDVNNLVEEYYGRLLQFYVKYWYIYDGKMILHLPLYKLLLTDRYALNILYSI